MRLADAVVPAPLAVAERSVGVAATALVGAIAHHGIADHLAEGPRSAAELASRTGLHPDALHRVLRGLAAVGIFRLESNGRFANNRLSRALLSGRPDHSRAFACYFAAQATMLAWAEAEHVLVDGKSSFERLFGMSVWEWLDRHPDEGAIFAQGMTGTTVRQAPVIASLYPFEEVESVCDVGGGSGALLSEILVRHSHLQGMLCDVPGVMAPARALFRQRGLARRATAAPGNFFKTVPAGMDVYLLKNVLHDWDDEACAQILGVVRRAVSPGQRVVVAELLVEKNDVSPIAALSDLQMLVVCSSGRERSEAELQRLLRQAGFEATRTFSHPIISLVEGLRL
jgi:hypothetical protein